MSNLPQGSEAPVDLISQCESNINGRILWDFHLRNVWWRLVDESGGIGPQEKDGQ
jgi:hypothetical protein